jgi:hypothetical protein
VRDQSLLLDILCPGLRDGSRKFSRFLNWRGLLIGVVLALSSSQPVRATTCFVWFSGSLPGQTFSTGAQLCQALVAQAEAQQTDRTFTASPSPSGLATSAGVSLNCGGIATFIAPPNNSFAAPLGGGLSEAGTCAATCAIGQTADTQGSGTANVSSLGGGSYCNNGCEYAAVPTTIILSDGVHYALGGAETTGNACPAAAVPVTTGNNCWISHGETICVDDDKGGATIAGDAIALATAPNGGQCIGYQSGGSLCVLPSGSTKMPTPPGPDTGTAGTPATPTATVTNGTTVANYYNSGAVSASSAPVQTVSGPGGTPAGQSVTSTETGASVAQPDDCGADGAACSSAGVVPTLPTQQDITTTTQGYYQALQGAPIVAAFSGILDAFPSGGECQTFVLSMFGHDYTMDAQCQILNSIASVLGAVMLGIYTLTGVRIVMSA